MFKRIVSQIPNTITLLNLLSGIAAIIISFNLQAQTPWFSPLHWAFIAIALAALFDFCDGLSARLLRAYSEIGKELDSLSDLVSFGVAPALLLYNTLLIATGGHWVSYCALMIPLFGAYRLAKFNVDTTQKTSFRGLPIPANAIFWIGFIAWVVGHGYCPSAPVLIIIIFFISSLMVSRMRMFSLKVQTLAWRENVSRYALLLGALLFVIFNGVAGFMWTIILYILISAVNQKRI